MACPGKSLRCLNDLPGNLSKSLAGLNNLSGLRPFCEVVNVYYNIYIFFYMFLRHYPYCCFLSLFISFAYACESKKRGFTLHISVGSPINRGDSGREPTLHRYSQKRHKWRKTVNPWCSKSPKCERFFIVFCQQNEHFELVNTHIFMSCYVNTVSQRVLLIKWSTIFFYSFYQNNTIGFNCLRSRFNCSTQ